MLLSSPAATKAGRSSTGRQNVVRQFVRSSVAAYSGAALHTVYIHTDFRDHQYKSPTEPDSPGRLYLVSFDRPADRHGAPSTGRTVAGSRSRGTSPRRATLLWPVRVCRCPRVSPDFNNDDLREPSGRVLDVATARDTPCWTKSWRHVVE